MTEQRIQLTEEEFLQVKLLRNACDLVLEQHDSGNGVTEDEMWRVTCRVDQFPAIYSRVASGANGRKRQRYLRAGG